MTAPVAVAVVSWNTRDLLARCLDSLRPEAESGLAEVWVVDNASPDGSAALVAERYPWVNLIASEENLGFGSAVNRVARASRSEWIAPANADIEVEAGALRALLDAGALDPAAAAVAPRLILPGGRTQHSIYSFPTLAFTALFNLGLARAVPALGDRLCLEGYWDPERARVADWAIGAFLVVRRDAWERVGGFDESQWMYAEDLDLGWRLARAGYRTRYVPAARVHHHSAAATAQLWGPDPAPEWLASTYAWMAARRGRAITVAVAAVNVAGAVARWLGLSAGAALRPRRFEARRGEMRRWARRHLEALRRGLAGAQAGRGRGAESPRR